MDERGKPELYDVKDHQVCEHCKYWYSYSGMCGYYLETGELRTAKAGKIRLPKGKCDKFKPGKADTAARREAFCLGRL